MGNKTFYAGAAILAVVVLVYMGLHNRGQRGTVGNFNQHTGTTQGAANQKAPSLTLAKLGGGTVSLADYAGKKPVVVDFWATWCPNCRRDMPHLNGFYQKYKDQVEVIGINLQEDGPTVASFIQDRGIAFPIALDPQAQASSAFGIQYTNTHILINKEGQIARYIPGDIREEDIRSLIQ